MRFMASLCLLVSVFIRVLKTYSADFLSQNLTIQIWNVGSWLYSSLSIFLASQCLTDNALYDQFLLAGVPLIRGLKTEQPKPPHLAPISFIFTVSMAKDNWPEGRYFSQNCLIQNLWWCNSSLTINSTASMTIAPNITNLFGMTHYLFTSLANRIALYSFSQNIISRKLFQRNYFVSNVQIVQRELHKVSLLELSCSLTNIPSVGGAV